MTSLADYVQGQSPLGGEPTGPASLAQVMAEEEELSVSGGSGARHRPIPTGFEPLDEILNGGMRPGELLVIGGPFGVGKTIWGLQLARNAVLADETATAVYICYEHDRSHLLARLLCLESAEMGMGVDALTLRTLARMTIQGAEQAGLISQLRKTSRYAAVIDRLDSYAQRLVLVKASGDLSTLDQIRRWVQTTRGSQTGRMLLVVDYLQKIPVRHGPLQSELDSTTFLAQGLKELAMSLGIQVAAIAASDRLGLRAARMRLADLRGSSAVQYEADIGLMLNNKFAIVSREHLVYNTTQAESMRNWVVLSVEKNRAGRNAVDMEFALDAAHFRIAPQGNFVRERLVDEKVTMA